MQADIVAQFEVEKSQVLFDLVGHAQLVRSQELVANIEICVEIGDAEHVLYELVIELFLFDQKLKQKFHAEKPAMFARVVEWRVFVEIKGVDVIGEHEQIVDDPCMAVDTCIM